MARKLKMKIINTSVSYTTEKLKQPFGFKGGFLTELWQVKVCIKTNGYFGEGQGVQSILWSDAQVFADFGEFEGNKLMLEITKYAASALLNKKIRCPIDVIDEIYLDVLKYAQEKKKVRETFVKNALVAVDNALWNLYAKINHTEDLMSLIPDKYKNGLSFRQDKLCNIPLITYGLKSEDIKSLLDSGSPLLKIKIGFDAGGTLSKREMVEWDFNRIKEIHQIAKEYKTEYTTSGNVLYYLDANGKYSDLEQLNAFISLLSNEGILERVILFEEPFDENNKTNVSSIPVRFVADESIHSLNNVIERYQLGYKAIALKPIAKTLSETLKIIEKANELGMDYFCADLTVSPLLVEWNKNIAARIKKIPEMKVGVLESNGAQNYINWEKMYSFHPFKNKKSTKPINGVYLLDEEFYQCSGGIFRN